MERERKPIVDKIKGEREHVRGKLENNDPLQMFCEEKKVENRMEHSSSNWQLWALV